jgi:hypothetical protein
VHARPPHTLVWGRVAVALNRGDGGAEGVAIALRSACG